MVQNNAARIALLAVSVSAAFLTAAIGLAQTSGDYGLYLADKARGVTYVEPGRYIHYVEGLQWPLQARPTLHSETYLSTVAVQSNGRIWAAKVAPGEQICVFDAEGNIIDRFSAPGGVASMTFYNHGGEEYLIASIYDTNRRDYYLWSYGPIGSSPQWERMRDDDSQGHTLGGNMRVRCNGDWLVVVHTNFQTPTESRLRLYALATPTSLNYRWSIDREPYTDADIDFYQGNLEVLAYHSPSTQIRRISSDGSYRLFFSSTSGEGYLAIAPDGVIYFFEYEPSRGWLIIRPLIRNASGDGQQLVSTLYPLLVYTFSPPVVGPLLRASASRCPEDVTGDGVVDDADLLAVLFAFGFRCGD